MPRTCFESGGQLVDGGRLITSRLKRGDKFKHATS